MKRILLFVLFCTSFTLFAQDTIKTFIISEARLGTHTGNGYVELTNVGEEVIDLHNFVLGSIPAGWGLPLSMSGIRLGAYIEEFVPTAADKIQLDPGESLWISTVMDEARERYMTDPENYPEPFDQDELYDADIVLPNPEDIISPGAEFLYLDPEFQIYLWQNIPDEDTILIDMVYGDNSSPGSSRPYDYMIAGIRFALKEATIVRKFSVKEGNTDKFSSKEANPESSEWFVIPNPNNWTLTSKGRKMMWTVGNHGDYQLNETTLSSDVIEIDWENKVLNVPWGVRNRDSVMMQFNYHEGLAWHYKLNTDTTGGQAHLDSSYVSARTGDELTIWSCGNEKDELRLQIQLMEPGDDANIVLPKAKPNAAGWFPDATAPVYIVSNGIPGGDTIFHIPFATRTDTLLKYLEKADEASWEFVFKEGVERPDLKNGDLLRITAHNGEVKDYYLDVEDYRPSHNARLAAIRWPDIPVEYKNKLGYSGDSIARSFENTYSYTAYIPADVNGIPGLIAHPEDQNASVEVKRALNLFGTLDERSVTFTVHAEDDTSVNVYTVELEKLKYPEDIQAWNAEPFVSQYVFHDQWSVSQYEICNPGTAPLDFSNYMMMMQWNKDPVDVLTMCSGKGDWDDRYYKYIPGYKWVSKEQWEDTPGICEPDLNVDPMVEAGDVFCLGRVSYGQAGWMYGASPGNWADYWLPYQMDIIFNENPWGEDITGGLGTEWSNASWYLYKILNDSIKAGLKPANDPEDFLLLETWSSPESGDWIIGGRTANADNQTVSWIRKPEYYLPKPGLAESFGTQVDNGTKEQDGTSEWLCRDRNYGVSTLGYNWALDILYITKDMGQHSMNKVTHYMSTVNSAIYKVSPGYTMDEEIRGIQPGTTVADFFSNIKKQNEAQSLTIRRVGLELNAVDVVLAGDSLLVLSADSTNATRYSLSMEALSDETLLSSSVYTILVSGDSGTVSNFEYGTTISELLSGLSYPAGARLDVLDAQGVYIPLKSTQTNGSFVESLATERVFFVVTAEDGVSVCSYHLHPEASSSDAFVLSDVYDVDEEMKVIDLVREGTNVSSFYRKLTPAFGASMQLKNKSGQDRFEGQLYRDDFLHVTAADKEHQQSYYLRMPVYSGELYFAYVLSDVYTVNQITRQISSNDSKLLSDETMVKAFMEKLILPDNATAQVLSPEAGIKDEYEDLELGDILIVTAGDGVTTRSYEILLPLYEPTLEIHGLSIYPNPGSGLLHIEGMKAGSILRVYSLLGSLIFEKDCQESHEVIHIDKQGCYVLIVSDRDGIQDCQKIIIR